MRRRREDREVSLHLSKGRRGKGVEGTLLPKASSFVDWFLDTMSIEHLCRVQLKHKQSFENFLSFHLKITFCMMCIVDCSRRTLRSKKKIISAVLLSSPLNSTFLHILYSFSLPLSIYITSPLLVDMFYFLVVISASKLFQAQLN